jgi:hypothetical protein
LGKIPFKAFTDFTKVRVAVTLNVNIFQEGHLGKESVKQLIELKNNLRYSLKKWYKNYKQ